ncbi:interferon kappa-like [Gopherus flavomarginatus]|uniref:interferon kappa-like n=1 Tax=Gopherus flavomarginatus TaxID=286002 RepID=UPI0021CC016D|nr:interferon kappa-like [Gopherus flavomarginatus]
MSTFCLLQISFVLLYITKISTQDCNILPLLHNKMIQGNLHLLNKMGQQFPEQCQSEKIHFKFPEQFLKLRQKENAKVEIQEILQLIFYIFTKNLTLAAWDGRSLERFQNGLNQQIEHLEACLTERMEKKQPYSRSEEIIRLKLKKYFQKIDNFLKDKQYSLCSWEIIRLEMRRCLQFIDKVIGRLRN